MYSNISTFEFLDVTQGCRKLAVQQVVSYLGTPAMTQAIREGSP
jgi:hypothetical protein